MKTIKILVLVSILAVTQSFALSKTQKNILLGIGAGAIIVHALESHNNTLHKKPHYSYKKHKKHHMKKHHRRGHRHYSYASQHNKFYGRKHYKRGCSRY
ncbi:MAG: hypothetical protein U9Q40_06580 [Campylobacterota bacterium]|nr:hypothetical protein [Campylobacterota bacterium]